MPAYQVTGPDGRKYRVNSPEGATSQDAIAYVYNTYYAGQPAAPAEPAPEEESAFRQVADIPVQVGTGIAQGIRFITDAFGADNPVSQNIRGVEGYLQGLLSAQAKQDQAEISRIMAEAQDKGIGDQVLAGLEAFTKAPVDMLSQAAGTALPTIVGGLAGGALRGAAGVIAGRVAMPAIGAVTGAGVAKSSIYDATKQAMLDAGADEATAETTASRAQEYGGKNLDQILIASGFGAFAAGTGLEKAVANRILGTAAAREAAEEGVIRRVVGEAAVEAAPEALQAGQEQLAANIALQREGFDVPTLRGVVGAATMEGLAGAVLGGGFGALRPRVEAEVARETPPVTEEITPEITPELLAPKEGRPARAAPIRAKTLEELRGELPAAPAAPAVEEPVSEEKVEPPSAVTSSQTDIEADKKLALRAHVESGKPFAIQTQGDGSIRVGPSLNAQTLVLIEPTSAERKALSLARADLDLADTPEERRAARDAEQAALLPAIQRAIMPTVTTTVAPEVTAPALPEIEVPEVAKLASQIADIVAPPEVARVEAPRMEVPSELPRTGIEQAVVGTTPRGVEMPLPRPVAAGPRVERAELPRLAAVEPVVERAAERAEVVPPALKSVYTSKETEPGFGGTVEPVSAVIQTKNDVPIKLTRAFQGKYEFEIDGKPAGAISYMQTPLGQWKVSGVRVEPEFQRQGVASAVYDFVEQNIIKDTFAQIGGQSEAGRAFREAREERKQPTPAPIFESIDVLNRPLPPVTEQSARERAPSLRRELSKAVKQFDADEMSGAELANRASMLLLQTQKERMVQPRQRGAEFVRERLMNASRRGEIDPDGVELASWFIQQNPLLVDDLGISIRKRPEAMEGTAAFYNPANRVVTLFKDAGDPQTATHEILHHTERLMPVNIRAGILKSYVKQLTKAAKTAKTDEERLALETLLNHHFGQASPNGYSKVIDQIKQNKLPKTLYQFVNPSEFWAINGTRIVQGRYDVPPGVVAQIKKWLREFVEKAKDALGLASDAPIIRALDSLAKADGKYKTDVMLGEAPAYMAVESIKEPKIAQKEKTVLEVRREVNEKMAKPGFFRRVVNKLTSGESVYEKVVENVQEQSRYIKKLQDDLRDTKQLVTIGENKNNVYDQVTIAPNRSANIVATEVEPVHNRLKKSIDDYMKLMKVSFTEALARLDAYRTALHEFERRETLYLRNVPLNNTVREEFLPGEPAMTAADARVALESRRSLAKNTAQAEAIQDMIRYLAANYADPRGYSPVKAKLQDAGKPTPEEMTTDFYDEAYSPIGPKYTPAQLEATRNEFENLKGNERKLVDQVMADWTAVNELNKDLNRRANYWVDKVDRVIESYGWKWYAPFKGNPRADRTLDTDTQYLSGDLSQVEESFNGRRTDYDSPLLQSLAESYYAASNAGRGTEVTAAIKNLIKLGVIKTKTKKPKVFTFEQRNSPDFDFSQVQGRDKIIHHNADGSIEVYSVLDPKVLEAIKTPYREMNEAVKIANKLTGFIGQSYTRFNPSFSPMDFIRNSITNAFLISAREGGGTALEYAGTVAANVGRVGIWKAGNISKLYSENNTAELMRLYNSGDPFYRDTLDMMKYGGRTMYRLFSNINDIREELEEQLGPKKIMRKPSQFLKWIDAYNDAFELTSRVAAYTVRKQQNIAEAKAKAKAENREFNVNDRKVMEDIEREAAAFALSLMNFRKIGKYGRELGAWFMFFRPAATGAVDAIDALRPGFESLRVAEAPKKRFARLEPEVQELLSTRTLEEEVKRLEKLERPDEDKIAELKKEIAKRQKVFKEFEAGQITRAKTARNTAYFAIAAGAALYAMAASVSGEDDEGRNRVTTDDMSRWTRYLRLPIIGGDGFLQVPWGFGVSALMSAGAQTAALTNGASDFKDFAGNMIEIGMDSYLPIPVSRINPTENFGAWLIDSVSPSMARPMVEFVLNVNAMGNPIYNSRAGKYADAFTGTAKTSEMHRKIAEFIFNMTGGEVSFSPDSVAFILNNYAGAIDHLAENGWNMFLTATGDKEFDAKKDTFILRSFIGRNSNYDARKFAEAEKEVQELARKLKSFEDFGTPEQVARFYEKNPNAEILIEMYNKSINGELRKLRQERNDILRDRTLTPKQRNAYIDDIQLDENYLKKIFVEDYAAYKGN